MSGREAIFDVIVVGSGAAGAAAALAARNSGASVLVVEKDGEATAGGDTRISGGGWFINNDVTKAARFLRALCGSFSVPDDVVEAWARETAENSSWMRSLGADVSITQAAHLHPEYEELDGSDCYGGMDTIGGQMGNFLLYDFLCRALVDRKVEVRYNTRARRLATTGTDKHISGVVVTDASNEEHRIEAKRGVILATGGFAANKGMVQDYLRLASPALWGSPACTGDGMHMAQEVGADLWHMNNMMTITGFKPSSGEYAGFYLSLWSAHNYVFVGADGRRLVNETAAPRHGHVVRSGRNEHFPQHPFFVVFDDRMRRAGPLSVRRDQLAAGWSVLMENYQWSVDNSDEVKSGWIKQANSIGELARLVGVDAGVLTNTVESYNDCCKNGVDELFGRNPDTLAPVSEAPFYAIQCTPLLGWSNGGPRRDGRARVLDTSGQWIKGLYAAGSMSSTYSWLKDGGFHVADAFAFGRIAGGQAAGYCA